MQYIRKSGLFQKLSKSLTSPELKLRYNIPFRALFTSNSEPGPDNNQCTPNNGEEPEGSASLKLDMEWIGSGELGKEIENMSEEERKVRSEWGDKFQEECITFQREWKKMVKTHMADKGVQMVSKELSPYQKEKTEWLVSKVLSLGPLQMSYISLKIADSKRKQTNISLFKQHLDWNSVPKLNDGSFPAANPNWYKQQEIMAQLGPLLYSGQSKSGSESPGAKTGGESPKSEDGSGEEEKREEKVLSDRVDVELSSFDPAKKIRLIKEIRQMLGLGLKESKEMVDSCPVTLKKGVKREDAGILVEKIEEFGGKCKMH